MTSSRFRYHADHHTARTVSTRSSCSRWSGGKSAFAAGRNLRSSRSNAGLRHPQLARGCWMTSPLWSVCRKPRARGATSLSPIEPSRRYVADLPGECRAISCENDQAAQLPHPRRAAHRPGLRPAPGSRGGAPEAARLAIASARWPVPF
jgi:hypothetical protein